MGKSSTEEEVRDRRGLYELIHDPTIVYLGRDLSDHDGRRH
jgi:hypothetical protein